MIPYSRWQWAEYETGSRFNSRFSPAEQTRTDDCGSAPPTTPEGLAKLLPADAYLIEGFLGQGGMGAVYRAVQISLNRPVAIKILQLGVGETHDFADRFRREVQAMAALCHPPPHLSYKHRRHGTCSEKTMLPHKNRADNRQSPPIFRQFRREKNKQQRKIKTHNAS